MLLLTPDLLQLLKPLRRLLPKCQFLQTARSVFRLYWMAVHNAKYGGQERAFEEVWKILPWFGASACLSGTESPRSSSKIHTFLSVLSSTLKEQLCTNTSDTLGWKRKPPPYVDHLDITVNFSNNHVALASLFAPLSLFMPDVTVQYNRLRPRIEEDRRLVLLADFPEGPNVLEHLKLDDWKKAFPCLDRLKRVRLLGGLGM